MEQQYLFLQAQWILCHSTDQLILVGSQSLGLEEAVALYGEPEPSLGHEMELNPVPDFDPKSSTSLVTCSLCLRNQASGMSWQRSDCQPEGHLADESFNVCMPCLQNGMWCYDKDHRLVS
ncbi:unnamed protein product [Clonostachys rhizophaga]|uniref:Uncharacterized protein n=1 Tax=Clonostachys rhizophaga TaxID=160324 RepID=A0A9N9YTT1_9HYPO|nr:unnamed protein product [Clonostachys rhizophaga]